MFLTFKGLVYILIFIIVTFVACSIYNFVRASKVCMTWGMVSRLLKFWRGMMEKEHV